MPPDHIFDASTPKRGEALPHQCDFPMDNQHVMPDHRPLRHKTDAVVTARQRYP